MKITTLTLLALAPLCAVAQEAKQETKPETKPEAKPPFKVVSMKCFSDKYINRAGISKEGLRIEGGFKIGNIEGRGSELDEFAFPETQRKHYLEFKFGAGGEKKKIHVTLVAKRTTAGLDQSFLEVEGVTSGDGTLDCEWSLKRDWPIGLYTAYFTHEGQAVGSGGYFVTPAKEHRESPIKADKVTILIDKDGKMQEQASLAPGGPEARFRMPTTGAKTKGAHVKMELAHLTDKGAKEAIPGSEVDIPSWPLEDTTLIYTLSLPATFPEGKYQVVVHVDEALLVAHDFEVRK